MVTVKIPDSFLIECNVKVDALGRHEFTALILITVVGS